MQASVGAAGESADDPKPHDVTGPPAWTTVPADDGSAGWEVYDPTTPAPRAQPAPAPAPTAAPTPVPLVQHRVTRPATVPQHPRRRPAQPETVVTSEPTGAVLAATSSATRPAHASVLLLAALCLAIACFAVGAIPAEQIRWRRGAIFVAYRRTSVTVVGGAFLVGAAILLATH
jgi:hypothetical protein